MTTPSKVQRYSFDVLHRLIVASPEGNYVKHADIAYLEARCAELEAREERWSAAFNELKLAHDMAAQRADANFAEVERLRAERDELRRRISEAPKMDYSDEELLMRAFRFAMSHGARRKPPWTKVMDVFSLGSTYSAQLCIRFGVDPDTGAAIAKALGEG